MKQGKILIIDDNEDVLFALNLLLEPYVEQIRVTTQPERIEHFIDERTIRNIAIFLESAL